MPHASCLMDAGVLLTKDAMFLQTTYVTAKPLDGMMMKVKLSEKAQARRA